MLSNPPVTTVNPPLTAGPAQLPDVRVPEPQPTKIDEPQPFPNPSLRLDPGLGLVVLEFRNNRGEISNSIPSQRVLDAYRTHNQPLPDTAKTGPATSDNTEEPDLGENYA